MSHLDQNVAKAPNYLWVCFWSRTQGVPLTMEFLKTVL